MVEKEKIHAAAMHLYGDGFNDTEYIERIARDIGCSSSTMRKYWYGKLTMKGMAETALYLLVERGAGN